MQWRQQKSGCIALASFIFQQPVVASVRDDYLPPPPPKVSFPAAPPTTLEAEGVKLEPQHRADLSTLAKERDEQRRAGNASDQQWSDLMDRAQYLFHVCAFPQNLGCLLRQIICRHGPPRQHCRDRPLKGPGHSPEQRL